MLLITFFRENAGVWMALLSGCGICNLGFLVNYRIDAFNYL